MEGGYLPLHRPYAQLTLMVQEILQAIEEKKFTAIILSSILRGRCFHILSAIGRSKGATSGAK